MDGVIFGCHFQLGAVRESGEGGKRVCMEEVTMSVGQLDRVWEQLGYVRDPGVVRGPM